VAIQYLILEKEMDRDSQILSKSVVEAIPQQKVLDGGNHILGRASFTRNIFFHAYLPQTKRTRTHQIRSERLAVDRRPDDDDRSEESEADDPTLLARPSTLSLST
jgi:hypothetical protein